MTLVWLIPAVLALATSLESGPKKPPCNKHTHGFLWPPPEARTATRAIEMCSLDVWRYSWEQVTVPYSDLKRKRRR